MPTYTTNNISETPPPNKRKQKTFNSGCSCWTKRFSFIISTQGKKRSLSSLWGGSSIRKVASQSTVQKQGTVNANTKSKLTILKHTKRPGWINSVFHMITRVRYQSQCQASFPRKNYQVTLHLTSAGKGTFSQKLRKLNIGKTLSLWTSLIYIIQSILR